MIENMLMNNTTPKYIPPTYNFDKATLMSLHIIPTCLNQTASMQGIK